MNFDKNNIIFSSSVIFFTLPLWWDDHFSWVFNIVGLTIFLISSEYFLRNELFRNYFVFSVSFFAVWVLLSTYYLFETLYINADIGLALSVFLVGIAIVLMLLPYIFMVIVSYLLRRYSTYIRLTAAFCAWMTIDLLTQNYNYSLSTLKLNYFYIDSPFSVYFPIGGGLLVSAVVLFTAMLLANCNRYTISVLVMVIFITLLASDRNYTEYQKKAPLKVSVVQTGENLNSIKTRDIEFPNNILSLLNKVPLDADLVVLPEVLSNQIIYNFPKSFFIRLRDWSMERDSDLIFGAFNNSDNETGIPVVSAFYVTSEELRTFSDDEPLWRLSNYYYGKQALIPFAETSPGILKHFDNAFDNSSLSKSYFKHTVWDVKGYLVSPSICYDFYFPNVVNKNGIESNLLLNIGSQTWLAGTQGPEVLHNFSRVRALENASPVLRVDTFGISELIDEKGRVVFQLPEGKSMVKSFELQYATGGTPYARYSDYPLIALLIANAIGVLFYSSVKRFRQSDSQYSI